MASSEVQERKNQIFQKISDCCLTILYFILYSIRVREREVSFLPKKRINKGEIRNEKEDWKSHYC